MYEELVKALRTCSERDSCFWLGDTCPYFNSELCDDKSGKAADAIEELSKTLEEDNHAYDVGYWAGRRDYEPKWIPVTERLPERNYNCLVCDDGVVLEGYMNLVGGWYDFLGDKLKFVSHWMPLPEPPESGR